MERFTLAGGALFFCALRPRHIWHFSQLTRPGPGPAARAAPRFFRGGLSPKMSTAISGAILRVPAGKACPPSEGGVVLLDIQQRRLSHRLSLHEHFRWQTGLTLPEFPTQRNKTSVILLRWRPFKK